MSEHPTTTGRPWLLYATAAFLIVGFTAFLIGVPTCI